MLTALLLAGSLVAFAWVLFGPLWGWLLVMERTPEAALRQQWGLLAWNFLVVFPFWLFGTELVAPEPYTLHARALGSISFTLLLLSFLGGLAGCFSIMSLFIAPLGALSLFLAIGFGSTLYEGLNALVRPAYDLHTYQVTETDFDPSDRSVSVGLARLPHDPGEDFLNEQISLSGKGSELLAQQNDKKQLTVNVLLRSAFLPDEVTYPASQGSRRLFDLMVIAYSLLYPLLSTALMWFAAAPARGSGRAMKKVL